MNGQNLFISIHQPCLALQYSCRRDLGATHQRQYVQCPHGVTSLGPAAVVHTVSGVCGTPCILCLTPCTLWCVRAG